MSCSGLVPSIQAKKIIAPVAVCVKLLPGQVSTGGLDSAGWRSRATIASRPLEVMITAVLRKFVSRSYGLAYPMARVWWRLRAPVKIGVRAIVLDSAGHVLLVRHAYGSEGWSFPGGGPRRHEPLAETALREVHEETNVVCQVERLIGIYDCFVEGKSDHVTLFLCRAAASAQPAPSSPEILEARFHPMNALPAQITESTRRRLQELQNGACAVWGRW